MSKNLTPEEMEAKAKAEAETKAKAEAEAEANIKKYRVAPGKSICNTTKCKNGIVSEGTVVTEKDFPGGKETFTALIKRKLIVK